MGVLKDLLVDVELGFLLLSDGGEGVECDIDEITDALVVQDDVGRRFFGHFSSDEGVHFGAVLIKLQKYEKLELGDKKRKQIYRKSENKGLFQICGRFASSETPCHSFTTRSEITMPSAVVMRSR